MKPLAVVGCLLIFSHLGLAGCSDAPKVPECNWQELDDDTPGVGELQEPRQFRLPTITYPYGEGPHEDDSWGFLVQLKVDATGRVSCYSARSAWEEELEWNRQRRGLMAELPKWRYRPFIRDGKAVETVVTELITEEEAAPGARPLPEVPLDQVRIGLSRSRCFGPCPAYSVEVHGDGRVVYEGEHYVDVVGKHEYRIDPERVAQLVKSLRAKDLWSLRRRYESPITDQPTHVLTFRLGDQTHQIEDYAGGMVGMPQSVSDFQREVDELSEAKGFVHLSRGTVARLEAEGFDFRSRAAADLLARAVSNEDSHDNAAMLRLIELGAPIAGAKASEDSPRFGSLLEATLIHYRTELVDALIARGALETNGSPDQSKIDAAFLAAMKGARLASVEKIWASAGTEPHPSLTFEDGADQDPPVSKTAPVIVLLKRWSEYESGWEGFAIAKWFVARGGDIKGAGADGNTLLHIAAAAGDVELARYVLDQGVNVSTPDEDGRPALDSAESEDVALLLLQAGTDLSKMRESGRSFRRYAEAHQWTRVVAWFDAHR